MKIYIYADMEGLAGVSNPRFVIKGTEEYRERGRKLYTDEVNACIGAVFEAGAQEVVVSDPHAGGGHLEIDRLDPRAQYEAPAFPLVMPSLDSSFAGVILLAHHAKAGTLNAFLDHTMYSMHWFDFTLNGESVGELAIEAAYAGHHGVPVILVSGDQAVCNEAKSLPGNVVTACVKHALGRNSASCMSIHRAYDLIRTRTCEAIAAVGQSEPFRPQMPATVQLTLYRSDMADELVRSSSNLERVDARTVRKKVGRTQELLDNLLPYSLWDVR